MANLPILLTKLDEVLRDKIGSADENQEAHLLRAAAAADASRLQHVVPLFFLWMLTDEKEGVLRFAYDDETRNAIQGVADLCERCSAEYADWRQAHDSLAGTYPGYAAWGVRLAFVHATQPNVIDRTLWNIDLRSSLSSAVSSAAEAFVSAIGAQKKEPFAHNDLSAGARLQLAYLRMHQKLIECIQDL